MVLEKILGGCVRYQATEKEMGAPNAVFKTIFQMIYDAQLAVLEGSGRINDEKYTKTC